MNINSQRKARRGGRSPLADHLRRDHCVSVRLNREELELLDNKRVSRQRGEWLRMAGLDKLPPQVPKLNQEAWGDLGRLASNLGQILAGINAGKIKVVGHGLEQLLDDIRQKIIKLRASIL